MTAATPKISVLEADTYANGDPTTFGLPLEQFAWLRDKAKELDAINYVGNEEYPAGVAGGILNVGREMSGALGIAVLGAFILSVQHAQEKAGIPSAEAFRRGSAVGLPIGSAIMLIGGLIAAMTLPRHEKGARHRKQSTQPGPVAVPAPATAAATVLPFT